MERFISFIEIPVEDFDRAVHFYSTILETEFKREESGKEKKALFPTGEGVLFRTPGFKPSQEGAIINFNVGNRLDEVVEKIKQLGGSITKGRTKIKADGDDYFVLFIDSEGNKMGLNGR